MRIGGKGQIRWTAVGVEAGGRSKWTERTKEKTKEKRKRKKYEQDGTGRGKTRKAMKERKRQKGRRKTQTSPAGGWWLAAGGTA